MKNLLKPGGIVHLTLLVVAAGAPASAREPETPAPPANSFSIPTVPARHKHVRKLVENSLRYFAHGSGMIDKASGYPVEGWNDEPEKHLLLRSFTQLTAIGLCLELHANVVAGYADSPFLSREQALACMTRLTRSLRQDQKDPSISSKGLLGNFLDLASGKRLGPLASEVDAQAFVNLFGVDKGAAIWEALRAKGWILPRPHERDATIQRAGKYGAAYFDGPLTPYSDKATKEKIMALLDQRVVQIVFGDNANLSAAVAKTLGALLAPAIKDQPQVVELRRELEAFLEDQQPGYAHLYDTKAGLFYFGWDSTRNRLNGWEDMQGIWQTGHMDYLVNEFRGPTTFVVLRYGFPLDPIQNLGFKMKPYRTRAGKELYALAPWEGSAFQALGLSLVLGERHRPNWRKLLENVVDIELDFAERKQLPGFLSESYTGRGIQYSGDVGIPDISVTPKPRITDAASLYTLGVAYSIAPEKIERFLATNWSTVFKLLSSHGPWEGFNITEKKVIPVQTSAHTLSLLLGLLDTGSPNMQRYLDSRKLGERLSQIFEPGEKVDLLSDEMRIFAWADKEKPLQSNRQKGAFHVSGRSVNELGIAFVTQRPEGMNLSGGVLRVRYHSAEAMGPAIIALKPAIATSAARGIIATQIFARFVATAGREGELEVPLPATPGLTRVKEVVITSGADGKERPIDFRVTGLECGPSAAASLP